MRSIIELIALALIIAFIIVFVIGSWDNYQKKKKQREDKERDDRIKALIQLRGTCQEALNKKQSFKKEADRIFRIRFLLGRMGIFLTPLLAILVIGFLLTFFVEPFTAYPVAFGVVGFALRLIPTVTRPSRDLSSLIDEYEDNLRKKVYGKHQNIDRSIEKTTALIEKIDAELHELWQNTGYNEEYDIDFNLA